MSFSAIIILLITLLINFGIMPCDPDITGSNSNGFSFFKIKFSCVIAVFIFFHYCPAQFFHNASTNAEAIIDDLYRYRDANGDRIIAMAFHNRDAKIIGLDGPYTGDIIYLILLILLHNLIYWCAFAVFGHSNA